MSKSVENRKTDTKHSGILPVYRRANTETCNNWITCFKTPADT